MLTKWNNAGYSGVPVKSGQGCCTGRFASSSEPGLRDLIVNTAFMTS